GSAGFHEILRIEMRARRVGRTGGVNDRQLTLLPERLKRREGRVQAEEAIEIDDGFSGNVDAGPHPVVLGLAVRNDDVQAVGGCTLEDDQQTLRMRPGFGGSERCAGKKARDGGGADHSEGTVADENAASDRHYARSVET